MLPDRPGIPPMAPMPETSPIDPRVLLDMVRSGETDLICILGPTACGKTRYAVELCRKLNALSSGADILPERTLAPEKGGDPLCGEDPSGAYACPDGGFKYIVPMIDARRMEVYAAVYSVAGDRLTEIEPQVVTPESFAAQLEEGPVLFIGDGALKCKDVLSSPNAFFLEACPRASAMLRPAEKAFKEGEFQDVAYFEPLYIKQFIAKVSTKNVLA